MKVNNRVSADILQADVLVSPEIRAGTRVYPATAMTDKLFALQAMALNIDRIRTRLWTKIKAGD